MNEICDEERKQLSISTNYSALINGNNYSMDSEFPSASDFYMGK